MGSTEQLSVHFVVLNEELAGGLSHITCIYLFITNNMQEKCKRARGRSTV